MARTRFITHRDLDGAVCAILARLLWGDAADITPTDHRTIDRELIRAIRAVREDRQQGRPARYDRIVVADIAPSAAALEAAAQFLDAPDGGSPCEFVILDHHESSDFSGFARRDRLGVYDPAKCGAQLLFERFEGALRERLRETVGTTGLRALIQLTGVQDRWASDDGAWPEARRLNTLFKVIRFDPFVQRCVTNLLGGGNPTELDSFERRWVAKQLFDDEQYVRSVVAEAKQGKDGAGRTYCGVEVERLASEVGHELLEIYPQAAYAAIPVTTPRGAVMELRSAGKVDVGAIARQLGGGGHPRAAGFPISAR